MPIPRNQTRSNSAYLELKRQILCGEIPGNTRLRETEVAASLNTGRTPAREAIKRLEDEGLLSHEGRGGLVVTSLDQQSVSELYAMREVLESAAVRFAAKHATVADMFTLDSILTDTRAGGDPVALNQAFHQAIYGAAHNRFLRRALDALTDSTYLLGRSTLSSADRARAALKEHTQIAEAIKAGDAERAEQAIQSHIRNALVERLKLLRRQPDAGAPALINTVTSSTPAPSQ